MTNIDHSKCDHPSTSSARAKCRRQAAGKAPREASTKTVDFSGSGGASSHTPRDRENACDICGVERVVLKGTDPLRKVLIYVGEKCAYYLKQADDAVAID